METLQAYVKGYEEYLSLCRMGNSRQSLAQMEARNPYVDEAKLNRCWQKGWEDAAMESYFPEEHMTRIGNH
jgi:hypothetical protein